jgi:hypothetical protein
VQRGQQRPAGQGDQRHRPLGWRHAVRCSRPGRGRPATAAALTGRRG